MIMIRINELRSEKELNIDELSVKAARILKISPKDILGIRVLKKSLDARKKPRILYVYSVAVATSDDEMTVMRARDKRVFLFDVKRYSVPSVSLSSGNRPSPVIVGFGPAGMFAALYLSYVGLSPIIIERGSDVESRSKKVRAFWDSGILDPGSNVQFGEGGAGTFSDGKLTTGIRDRENRDRFVLERLVKYGAPESILTDSLPHIGSDILTTVVKNLREDVIEHGGSIRFDCCFTGFETGSDGALKGIYVNNDEFICCDSLILATGHSARDTISSLHRAGLRMEEKSFAVGLRVQHPQEQINLSMYGEGFDRSLKAASYKLTFGAPDGRGVYSFCMCPGGFVVNSSSEEGLLCVNGMSYSGRKGDNANSAIVVSVGPEDFRAEGFGEFGVLSGMEFQRELERRAFKAGSGLIPCQLFDDFRSNSVSRSFGDISPHFKGGHSFANLRNVLPDFISADIISAFSDFGKKIRGFDRPDALLSGVESRTSSPVRILRDASFQSSVPGIFPAGEGAGYAGGIMSAAIDGLKTAEAVLRVSAVCCIMGQDYFG